MRKRIGVGITVGFFSLAAVSGCSSHEDGPASEPGQEIPRLSSLSEVQAPINRYVQTEQEDSIILKARSKLAAQCLKRYGLPPQSELTDPLTGMVRNPAPFYLSEQDAARYGYRAPSGQPSTPPATSNSTKRPALSASERETIDAVMNGWGNTPKEEALHSYRGRPVTRTGCIGESDARLMANTTRPRINGGQQITSSTQILNLILDLKSRASDKVEGDPRYKSMISSWASCMRNSGHAYATPSDAQSAAAEMAPTASGGPSGKELRLARQDAVCQQKVNYLGVVGHLTGHYQKGVVQEYRETLADVRENIDQRVAMAKKINAAGG
ncbi:hypothetical protein [Streptomyces sp. S.PNR 29]|uniref:hypothetical protein n=1 Tax=Streptomyces sp. S.PNR 29 TaxID=2973805 RepID=UPI0025AFF006|nr:hypothetical protein [Streptomyces sp. S.PNR 29]MDN0194609.1 hypothetical protein [Streptomyces sp. S.PNR 29]